VQSGRILSRSFGGTYCLCLQGPRVSHVSNEQATSTERGARMAYGSSVPQNTVWEPLDYEEIRISGDASERSL
jgi:hypothetical protein